MVSKGINKSIKRIKEKIICRQARAKDLDFILYL